MVIAHKTAAAAKGHLSPVFADPKALREVIAERVELLIDILDRLDGDADAELDDVEDENLDESWTQPMALGPAARTVRRQTSRSAGARRTGLGERGQRLLIMPGPSYRRQGLREAVRDRLARYGDEAPTDAELLGALLGLVLPGADTQVIAERLLSHFGGFALALAAPVSRLTEVEGLGETSATNLKLILAAAKRFARDLIDREQPIFNSWRELISYLRTTMAFEHIEQARILFLDRKNRLIADEVQQRGTVDHTPIYPREVVKRALELNATALILVHNHPSGDPRPSAGDVSMTLEVQDAAKVLGLTVFDHVIIARKGHVSLREMGYI